MEISNAFIADNMKYTANEIHVAFITDRFYLPNTCIAVYSVKKNMNKDYIYHMYIITQQISESELEPLKMLESAHFIIHLIPTEIDTKKYELANCPVTAAATIKFKLAEVLHGIDKVLYLDGDTIIQSNLIDLFYMDIQEKYAATVRDLLVEGKTTQLKGLHSNLKFYFNSGMMLLNLKKMREENIAEKLIDYRLNGINYFMDQDALNVVFAENVEYLPCKFNYMVALKNDINDINDIIFPEEYGYDKEISEYERLHQADILHLAGRKKAWREFVPYVTEIFMKYYLESPFHFVYSFNPVEPELNTHQIPDKYIFPFGEIPKNSHIAIWGAGKVGQEFYRQVQSTAFCEIICVIDECADQYNQDEKTWKGLYKVLTPEKLLDYKMNYIVIAVKREQLAKDIMDKIRGLNIENNVRIIWKYPVY